MRVLNRINKMTESKEIMEKKLIRNKIITFSIFTSTLVHK